MQRKNHSQQSKANWLLLWRTGMNVKLLTIWILWIKIHSTHWTWNVQAGPQGGGCSPESLFLFIDYSVDFATLAARKNSVRWSGTSKKNVVSSLGRKLLMGEKMLAARRRSQLQVARPASQCNDCSVSWRRAAADAGLGVGGWSGFHGTSLLFSIL